MTDYMNGIIRTSNLIEYPCDAQTSRGMTSIRGADMMILTRKYCGGCKQWKSTSEFYKNRHKADGFANYCKVCAKASHDKWMQENPGKHGEFVARWAANNPEKVREKGRRWAENHPDKVRAKQQKRIEKNPALFRLYRLVRRARVKGAGGKITTQEWEDLKAFYNYTCLCCGRQEPEIELTLDHVKAIVNGGSNTIDNAQPLCGSCNSKKGSKHIDYRTR